MITFPNSKINLGLNILNKRANGYHDLETCIYPILWHDILEIIPSKSFSIIGSNGTIQKLNCKNSKEFMSKFKFLKENIDEDIVSFIGLD